VVAVGVGVGVVALAVDLVGYQIVLSEVEWLALPARRYQACQMLNLLVDHFGIFRTNDVDYTSTQCYLLICFLFICGQVKIQISYNKMGGSSYESSKYVLPKFLGGILLYYKTKNS
jgi:hypothetical protein